MFKRIGEREFVGCIRWFIVKEVVLFFLIYGRRIFNIKFGGELVI